MLYPIEKKNYFDGNSYTASSWKDAEDEFSKAFTITIFGYSAPTSDIEAVEILKKSWLEKSNRKFEHVKVIDTLESETLYERWKAFTPTLHLKPVSSFEESRLWSWPRRSCEALLFPMSQGMPCEAFPLPETDSLNELQNFIKEIARYEEE